MQDHTVETDDQRQLERVRGLRREEFMERFVVPEKPVILEGAISNWQALSKWNPEFWVGRYGEKVVVVDDKGYPLHRIIEFALCSTESSPAPYYRNIRIRNEYPELLEDLSPYPDLCEPNWFHSRIFYPIRNRIVGGGGHYELFIGGKGASFPYLHFDAPGAHTFIHQIWGRKMFILFAPSDAPYLYPREGASFSVSSIPDIENVDREQFPLYKKATPYTVELGPGDTLFMPYGCWHTAKMLSFSITLGIDVANQTNWEHVMNYMARRARFENMILGAMYMAYMRAAGILLRLRSRN
jgi:hypothetical protein